MPPNNARELSGREKRTIALLGLPSFGLALSVTVIVTYVPLLAKQFTNSTVIVGLLIASEGLVALFLPIVAGSFSDHLRTRIGGRLPFVVAGLPLAVLALAAIGFIGSMSWLIVWLMVFFIAYYLMYEPYRALYPDLVADEAAGRAQSIQALWRGIGSGLALAGGGFLFAATAWLPFTVSALLLGLSTTLFLWVLFRFWGVPPQHHHQFHSVRGAYRDGLRLLKRDRMLRHFVVMNALWELTLAALKTFILLYLTTGLGYSKTTAAIFVGSTAVIMFIAAPIGGKLADAYGLLRVARIAAAIFGVGLLIPSFTTTAWFVLAIMPIAAGGGAIVLTLPYAVLMPMMPANEHGRLTGIYSTSRGLGIMLGPLLAGTAIALTRQFLPARGYSAMWLVCGIAMLLSLYPLQALRLEKSAARHAAKGTAARTV